MCPVQKLAFYSIPSPSTLLFSILSFSLTIHNYLTSPLFFKELIGRSFKETFAAQELNPEHDVPLT